MDLVQKALVGQNVTTGSPMYERMDRVLKDDSKAKFLTQQTNLVNYEIFQCFDVIFYFYD